MRLEFGDLESYRSRLDALDRVATTASPFAIAEARQLIETILRDAAPALELEKLEAELAAATNFDLDSLEESVAQVLAMKPPKLVVSKERTIDPVEEAQELSALVATLRANQAILHRTESWLRLEMGADSRMMNILVCAASARLAVDSLIERGELKLQHLSDLTLTEQWARVQRDFEASRILPALDPKSLPTGFLDLSDPLTMRRKLARYIIAIKPSLVAARFAANVSSYPLGPLGPARLMSLNGTVVPLENDGPRLDLLHTLSQLSAVWTNVIGAPPADLAALLRLPPACRILSGSDAQDAAKRLGALPPGATASVAVYQVRALLAVLERLHGGASPVVQVLERHKLGLEVTLPESRKHLTGASELTLQKQLCRYLLDQSVYAEGTKFGPFETDLVASVRALATVIEVKIYTTKAPTDKSLRANIAQLQDYMDKRPVRPHGVLVIYNLSNLLLVGPNSWIRGRYWITCINLGATTGSKRRDTLVLQEGTSEELITSYRTNAATKKASRQKAG